MASSIYPIPPGEPPYETGYRYEDASQQLPRAIPPPPQAQYEEQAIDPTQQQSQLPQQQSPLGQTPTRSKNAGEVKPRLRKACDSCSVRKVKCDESGPPCKSCAALDIPCTFNRPSRRRGPPNRHAEAIKRQRLDDGSYNLMAASPTRDAAYGLAALAAPVTLSAESICDIPTLQLLIDDYFTYIHPVIPIPHEPTFRAQFERREDRTDRSFLAMLAGMIESLVVSFPRRPRQLFTSEEARARFPHAGALLDRCRQVFNEARGAGYLDRDVTLYDACGSYFAAVSGAYKWDMIRWRLYNSECVMMLRILGFQKAEVPPPPGSFEIDYVYQQVGRRLFWLSFVGTMSVRQLGNAETDLLVPPNSRQENLPPLPLEIDDEYITSAGVYAQPEGLVSALIGFNYNVRIYIAFYTLCAIEMAVGQDMLYDWDRQRRIVRNALREVKDVTKDVPLELKLNSQSNLGEWPPRGHPSDYSHLFNGRRDPSSDQVGLMAAHDPRRSSPYPKHTVQFEIQKANIYATQLATRSYLVERFWNLYEIHERQQTSAPTAPPISPQQDSKANAVASPTAAFVAGGLESRLQQNPSYAATSGGTASESQLDAGEQAMAVEREDIIRDLALLLRSINQVNMEPNGHSFCHKIRQVASTLLSQDRSRMSHMPTLDSATVNEYLNGFLEILRKLERLGPTVIRGTTGNSAVDYAAASAAAANASAGGANGDHTASAMDGQERMRTLEEIEEEELVHWASLKEHQERFVMKYQGYLGSL